MRLDDPLSQLTTQRPVAVVMIFLAATVFGYFSIGRLPLTLMPELSYPTLTVRTEYPGAAPEEVENDVSRPIEEALSVLGGLNQISSTSRSGVGDVVLEFVWGTDMSEATQNVLEKLDLVFLPDDAERPLILHFDPSLDPIMELSFSGKGDRFEGEQGLRRLRRIAELQIKRELEPVKGVAAVRIRGGLEEEIQVMLDEQAIRRAGLSIKQVIDRLAQENINVAGGTIKEGRTEYMVRTLNEYTDLEEIRETIIAKFEDRMIRVRDVAQVARSHKEREIITQTNGAESVIVEIYKEADANIVSLAKSIKTQIGEIKTDLERSQEDGELAQRRGNPRGRRHNRDLRGPGGGRRGSKDVALAQRLFDQEGAQLKVVADRSIFIESSIKEVRNTAIQGGILAVIILFLFLRNFKSTVIIGVSIPVSLLVTFAPLNLMGVSLNIMSLGGLALGIGMLVDSSIVVLESIYRCIEEGDTVMTAAIRGTKEVRGAVFASTLTSIAVFFPMVFVEGIAGQVFGDLGLAVVNSLLASLVVALFLIPMLASRRGLNLAERTRFSPREIVSFRSHQQVFDLYREGPLLAKVLGTLTLYLPARLIIGWVLELVGNLIQGVVFGITFLVTRLLAPLFVALFRVLSWLPLKLMDAMLEGLQRLYPPVIRWAVNNGITMVLLLVGCFWFTWEIARSLESELLPEIHQGEFTIEASLPVGTPIDQTSAVFTPIEEAILAEAEHIRELLVTYGYDVTNTKRSDEGEHSAKFKVLLEPSDEPAALEEQVVHRLRAKFENLPDVDIRVVRPVLFSATTPIEVEIHGTELAQLKNLSEQARLLMEQIPNLSDVESTLKSGAPEIQIHFDREKILRYGLNLRQVADLVKNKVKGEEATKYNLQDRRIPILVRLEERDRHTVEDVSLLTINPTEDNPIPLESVAELYLDEGPSEVRRIDGSRAAVITANLAGGSLSEAVTAIEVSLGDDINWPEATAFYITGQNEEMERSSGSLYLALFLSLFLVYVIMASQFESLIYPFVIMFTIPLAFLGTMLGLAWLKISLSVVVFLGMIMLAGIVVNNAIVLVDYINTLKARGHHKIEAIVTAGQVRLRPILMTTATTVLGLLPMALGHGDGAEIRTPMAIAVIFGLLSSTVLTLIFIPAIYAIVDNLKEKVLGLSREDEPMEPITGATP
ncbi:Efflux RND transporter permease subunit [Sulfidibacter corallicola]|uniref:Efflux RND transporter permease subunit n=1 Tax=Sulfidibacter corallicola TaxID=2818388 RepID=A0A8A4U3X0_SULCO|nr:efflux RND transporter permease subunit [Sulfidibacter corallicola]QTD53445.1 efflux RND transporter permease subunit [Sulfidibacter corallicola]